MVKHINNNKIQRAAGCKVVCHSYSGATINQIKDKFQSKAQGYSSIIIHAGTNDLVNHEPEDVAVRMENLITTVSKVTKRLAISSVIRRHDGKVSNRKIDKYNNLLHDLCDKYRVTFINNDDINCNLLNHSKLHLNHEGDRVLGSAFCSYLKAYRNSPPRKGNNYNQINDKKFFHVYNNQMKDWLGYLQYVNHMTRK